MKKITMFISLGVATILMNCASIAVAKYNSSIPITVRSFGDNYKSLGFITVTDGGLGSATFGVNSFQVGARGIGQGLRSIHQETFDDATKILNEKLVVEAKKLGGNAIIHVSYGASEVPVFIPWLGPLAVWGSYAMGEVVVLKESAPAPAKR